MGERSVERFLEACGAVGPFRLTLEGPDGPGARSREFHQPFVIVGRGPETDLVVDHPDVSRRHAYLQLIAGRLFCVDLKSRTGTHWQGRPEAWGWVGQADGIRIGPVRIRPAGDASFRGDGVASRAGADPLPISRSFEQPGLPEMALELLEPRVEVATWRVSRAVVLLGQLPVCRVRLTGAGVSAIHASLVRTPAGSWLVDLLGRGDLLVNGKGGRCIPLDEGDELQVGGHRLRVRTGLSSSIPARLVSVPARCPEPSLDRPAGLIASDVLSAGGDALLGPLLHEFGQMQQQMADQFQQSLMMMFRMFSSMHQDQMALIREELARVQQLSQEQQSLQAKLSDPRLEAAPEHRPILRLVHEESPSGPAAEAGPLAQPAPPPAVPERPQPRGSQTAEDIHGALIERISAIQEERQGRWQKILGAVIGKVSGDTPP